jgi:hypothetical protein
MLRRVFPCFLILLLVSAITDDLLASLTPEPEDDCLAAANNEYLFEMTHGDRAAAHRLLPFHLEMARMDCVGPLGILDSRLVQGPNLSRPLADSLYVFMSLQR